MAKKYYAVRNGRANGVFFTWEDCKAQVDGVSGAEYKGFSSIKDAEDYVSGKNPEEKSKKAKGDNTPQPHKDNVAIAYVDGSYNPATHEFSCGAVLFYEHEKVLFSKKYNDPEMCDMRNVAGEIMGAASVISYCIDKGIKSLEIYHDYEGVAKWATGEWKANKVGTKAYAELCEEARHHLNLSFVKVKGHSGDKYNDEADMLAKQALGLA